MKLTGMKIAILADTNSQDYELWYLLMRMLEEGADVFVMGPMEVQAYSNHNDHSVRIDTKLSVVLSSIFDAVIVPGIYSSHWPSEEAAMLRIIERVLDRGDLVAMICDSNWLPVSPSVFKGREVTSSIKVKPMFVSAGANWVDQEVVQDGNLISSRGRAALEVFSQAIVDRLVNNNLGGRK